MDNAFLVLYDARLPNGKPSDNTREKAKEIFDKVEDKETMFGIEQEFFFTDQKPNCNWYEKG